MKKIKVAFLTVKLEIGGTEKHILEVTKRIDKERFDPLVISLMGRGELQAEFEKEKIRVEVFNYPGLRSNGRLKIGNLFSSLGVFYQLVRFLRREKPHIVHAYLPAAYIMGFLASRLARVPTFFVGKRGLGTYRQEKPFLDIIEKFIDKTTDVITVNSNKLREIESQRGKHLAKKIKLIYNGIDTAQYSHNTGNDLAELQRQLGLDRDTPVVGIVANLIPYKGHREFIEAASIVNKEFPDTKYLIIGRDDGIGEDLRNLARTLNIMDTLIFTGARNDIPALLALIDIQVLASHEESLSNAILEGMAAGKPLVVTDVGGNTEMVIPGETGIVVPPRNPEALANGILTLLRDREKAGKMGLAGQERVKNHFDINKMIKEMEELYIQTITKNGSHQNIPQSNQCC